MTTYAFSIVFASVLDLAPVAGSSTTFPVSSVDYLATAQTFRDAYALAWRDACNGSIAPAGLHTFSTSGGTVTVPLYVPIEVRPAV